MEKAAPSAADHVACNRWKGEAAKRPNPSPFTPLWEARQVSQSVFNRQGNPSQRSRPLPQLKSHCDEAEQTRPFPSSLCFAPAGQRTPLRASSTPTAPVPNFLIRQFNTMTPNLWVPPRATEDSNIKRVLWASAGSRLGW